MWNQSTHKQSFEDLPGNQVVGMLRVLTADSRHRPHQRSRRRRLKRDRGGGGGEAQERVLPDVAVHVLRGCTHTTSSSLRDRPLGVKL